MELKGIHSYRKATQELRTRMTKGPSQNEQEADNDEEKAAAAAAKKAANAKKGAGSKN